MRAAVPSGEGGGDDDDSSTNTNVCTPLPVDDDNNDGQKNPAHGLRSKLHKKKASRNLPPRSIKKKYQIP
jgi:hypothetical protein